jgi:hypothetical protein
MKRLYFSAIVAATAIFPLFSQTQELDLDAVMDNTIFEEGELSNGAGDYTFTGTTKNGDNRRALIKFDLASDVPEGITIDSAALILNPSKVKTYGTEVSVYKVLTEWGEGTSDAINEEGQGAPATQNDATWTKAMTGGASWIHNGGDYEIESSATAIVISGTASVFRSPGMLADVESWLTTPADNHGWIIIGDESASSTAIRFFSRENAEFDSRPLLRLYYQGTSSAPSLTDRETNLKVYQGYESGEIIVQNDADLGKSRFEIFSITGSLLFSKEVRLGSGITVIESKITDPGTYIFRVTSSGNSVPGKFIMR